MGWGGHPPQADPNIATAEAQQVALQKQQEDFYEKNIAPQELAQMKQSTDASLATYNADTDLANYQMGMSKQLSDQYQQNFAPVINQVASDAMQGDSDAYQQSMVDRAVTDAGQQYGSTNAGLQRDLAARGINPGSGNAVAAMAGSRDAEGLGRTQAANATRLAAKQMGWTQAVTAAGVGGGLVNAAGTLSGMSGQARTNGVSAAAMGLSAVGQAGTIDNGYAGTQASISNDLGNLGLGAWQTALQRNQIADKLKNSLLGSGAGGGSSMMGGMMGGSGAGAGAGAGAAGAGGAGGAGAAGGADAMAAMAVMA